MTGVTVFSLQKAINRRRWSPLRMVTGSHDRNKASNHKVCRMPSKVHLQAWRVSDGVETEPLRGSTQGSLAAILPPPK